VETIGNLLTLKQTGSIVQQLTVALTMIKDKTLVLQTMVEIQVTNLMTNQLEMTVKMAPLLSTLVIMAQKWSMLLPS
jgi:hypothetical protein